MSLVPGVHATRTVLLEPVSRPRRHVNWPATLSKYSARIATLDKSAATNRRSGMSLDGAWLLDHKIGAPELELRTAAAVLGQSHHAGVLAKWCVSRGVDVAGVRDCARRGGERLHVGRPSDVELYVGLRPASQDDMPAAAMRTTDVVLHNAHEFDGT